MQDICSEKHKRVDERLDHHERWLGEHEKKIDALTTSDATNTTQIANLCRQIGSQTKAIWGLVSGILMVLIGFFVWYVQNK
jgi:tetrahydromethanopterin S-methyltransferase subunit G